MALPRALPCLARLARPPSAPRRARSDSCAPPTAPPCPPCVPPPRPPCRARPPERMQALRVTCCPPPRGKRPPCATPLPACALDCSQARSQKECDATPTAVAADGCEFGRDRVAGRLAAARDARRQDYMREVRERRPPPPPHPPSYRLPAERECAHATDGRNYTVAAPRGPVTVSRACGPCREPPPPKCVELVPDNECQVRSPNQVDHCAHRPRVIVSIDRSKTRETTDDSPRDRPAAAGAGGFASRLMKSLNLSRDGGEQSNPKCSPHKSGGGAGGKAQFAGDTGWCDTIKPAAVPARCKPPGQAERLRRRACRDLPCRQPPPAPPHARPLHTTPDTRAHDKHVDLKSMAAQTKVNEEKLEKMLNARSQLKEAAKGRVVDCAPAVSAPTSGGLEIPVPQGTAAVRVNVSLDPTRAARPPPRASQPAPCATRAVATECGTTAGLSTATPKNVARVVPIDDKTRSWLSIKTLQKKLVESCRKAETSNKDPCKNPCEPKPSPCAPPTKPSSPCKPPAKPTNIPPNPCAPPPKKKKPTCFAPFVNAY